jgi:hypothetical protein
VYPGRNQTELPRVLGRPIRVRARAGRAGVRTRAASVVHEEHAGPREHDVPLVQEEHGPDRLEWRGSRSRWPT